MSLLKGNYKLKDAPQTASKDVSADKRLEQEYYKEALRKLGGSIAFIMKGKTFLWTGDDEGTTTQAARDEKKGKKEKL